MSGKMFWQLVLLIIIAALVFGAMKIGVKTAMWQCHMKGGKMMGPWKGPSQQEVPQK